MRAKHFLRRREGESTSESHLLLNPYMTVRWRMAEGSGQGVWLGEWRGLRNSERGLLSMISWGSCSMVSCSRRLVSWIRRSICGDREGRLRREAIHPDRHGATLWKQKWEEDDWVSTDKKKNHLIQRDMTDWCAIDFQNAVTDMDGILHIGAYAVWV